MDYRIKILIFGRILNLHALCNEGGGVQSSSTSNHRHPNVLKSQKTKFYCDYHLRWRRLPIEERGGGDYKLRSALAAKQVWVAMITR